MPKYDLVPQVVARPRATGATNNVAAPQVPQATAGLQAQATAQQRKFADAAGTSRVQIGLQPDGSFGMTLYNAAGTEVVVTPPGRMTVP